MLVCVSKAICFFFNDTATTEIYTLSLHDALPISLRWSPRRLPTASTSPHCRRSPPGCASGEAIAGNAAMSRSEEHTSELQSRSEFVCRLLLENKKINAKPGQYPAPPATTQLLRRS